MHTLRTFSPARLLWALLPLLMLLGACKKNNTSQEELNKLIEQHKTDDDTAIRKYLTDNNITNFERKDSGLFIVRQNTPGTGATPLDNAQVRVKYVGYFLGSGLRFDASIDNGSTCGCSVFTLGQVIQGWTEAIKTMHTGDKVMILVPSHLAYGATGYGNIGPFQPLIFNIELISFTNP